MCRSVLVALTAAILLLAGDAGTSSAAQVSRRTSRRTRAAHKRVVREPPPLDVNQINDPNLRDAVGPGSSGAAVIRAEILLDRIKYSPGQIQDSYDDNLRRAITAFQGEHGLDANGTADAKTWELLNNQQAAQLPGAISNPNEGKPTDDAAAPTADPAPPPDQPKPEGQANQPPNMPMTSDNPADVSSNPSQNAASNAIPPALVSYTLAKDDVEGPFTKLPKASNGEQLMLLEAKLERLNYGSAVEKIGEKFHIAPRLLARLNPGKSFEKEGEEIIAPNVLTPPPPKAASVVVDGFEHSVRALDAQGKVLAFYPATIGSSHDPLPIGQWKILGKSAYPKFHYNPNLFWDSENKNTKATLPPGPKSPVGVVWIALSKEHYGIHGTPNPAAIGSAQSHGCIRLTNWDAEELASIVGSGTPAILKE